jgi:hydrogenase maturation factor
MSREFSDVLFEAQVLYLEDSEDGKTGVADFQGVRIPVNLSLVPGIRPGDIVLIEGRIALTRVEDTNEIR